MEAFAKVRWLAVGVTIAFVCGFFVGLSSLEKSANAQLPAQGVSEKDVLVLPVQIDRDSYGIAMVDTGRQTMWIYELNRRGTGSSRMRLVAARSWQYDKLLEDYNTGEPKPSQVKELLERFGPTPPKQQEKSEGQAAASNKQVVVEPNGSGKK